MALLHSEGSTMPSTLIGVAFALLALYTLSRIVYQLFLDPLSKVPGPLLNRLSTVPYISHLLRGTTVQNTLDLHAKYGPVVRVSPTDVSFTSIDTAWQQIYGFRTGEQKGHATHEKSELWLGPRMYGGAASVLRAAGNEHSRQRKLLSHAFSEKALATQEDIIQLYVDKLVDQLKRVPVKTGEAVNVVEWYNWTTFDIISDLLFGESFGNLDDLKTHKYVRNLFDTFFAFSIHYMRAFFPITKFFDRYLLDTEVLTGQIDFRKWIIAQTEKRIATETERPDFMGAILKHQGDKGQVLTESEIQANASLLIGAGSETTATFLSGTTWLLLKNPGVLAKLQHEVRSKWSSYEQMTLAEVARLPYLQAVISEGLRYFPPVPTGFPRVIDEGGEMVSGYYIPKGSSVYVSSFAAHHDKRNFTSPEKFDPERWLGAEQYANDKRNSIQPFSFGPHGCLGKNLAYGEMRLILAKLMWSFDFELDSSSENWLDECLVFLLWKKPELSVRVKDRFA